MTSVGDARTVKDQLKETKKFRPFPTYPCLKFCTSDFILSTGKIRVNILFIAFPEGWFQHFHFFAALYLRRLPLRRTSALSFWISKRNLMSHWSHHTAPIALVAPLHVINSDSIEFCKMWGCLKPLASGNLLLDGCVCCSCCVTQGGQMYFSDGCRALLLAFLLSPPPNSIVHLPHRKLNSTQIITRIPFRYSEQLANENTN